MLLLSYKCECSTKFMDVFYKAFKGLGFPLAKGFQVANCEALELDLTFVHVA